MMVIHLVSDSAVLSLVLTLVALPKKRSVALSPDCTAAVASTGDVRIVIERSGTLCEASCSQIRSDKANAHVTEGH